MLQRPSWCQWDFNLQRNIISSDKILCKLRVVARNSTNCCKVALKQDQSPRYLGSSELERRSSAILCVSPARYCLCNMLQEMFINCRPCDSCHLSKEEAKAKRCTLTRKAHSDPVVWNPLLRSSSTALTLVRAMSIHSSFGALDVLSGLV